MLLFLMACQNEKTEPTTSDDSNPLIHDSKNDPPPDPDPCLTETALADVGTGDREFEALTDGDDIPVIHGSQGGNHILGSLRLWHMAPIVLIHYTLTLVEGEILFSDNLYRLQMLPEDTCQSVYIGLYGYIGFIGEGQDPNYPVDSIMQREVRLAMTAEDTEGNTASDAVIVIPVPTDPPEP